MTDTRELLAATWDRPPGLRGWFAAVNSRTIGARYVTTGCVFFVIAGILALLMRTQLATSENGLLDAERYNQVFTMHGTAMMFLFAIPIVQGFALWILPMILGTRDVAFPRLNAFGYWVYLIAGSALWITLIFDVAPDSGWFAYPPLSESRYSAGMNMDFYATVISMLEISALAAALELIASIFTMRAPGMSLNRMPLFGWAVLITSFMIVFAMTPLIVATLLLEMDRKLGTAFYIPAAGGDPILWQHLFWFFGHPEVYIMFLPPLGMIAAIVAAGSRRPVAGYLYVVLSFVAVGLVSFGVWVHHMFASGRSPAGMALFSVASFSIAIPSAVQIFATLTTVRFGRPRLTVPMLYLFGFIFVFTIGGISGVMLGSIPFNLQAHDSHFVVAHFHYVILGGVVLPLLGGLTHWYPKFTGRLLNHRMGIVVFGLIFTGINLTFLPMHLTGLLGLPRRSYTYLSGLGLEGPNMWSTLGAFVIASGVLLYIVNWFRSNVAGRISGPNPWGAGTLEWSVSSPPPPYGFRVFPVVVDRNPLWRPTEDAELDPDGPLPLVEDLPTDPILATRHDRRESIGTTVLDAVPEQRLIQPGPSYVPMTAAVCLAVAFVGMAFDVLFVPIGLTALVAMLFVWHRPARDEWDLETVLDGPDGSLPPHPVAASMGIRTPMWWGWVMFLVIVSAMAATLIMSYLYLASGHTQWPVGRIEPRAALPGGLIPAITGGAAALCWKALGSIRRADRMPAMLWLVAGAAMGVAAIVIQALELTGLDYNWATNVSGSLDWVLAGFVILVLLVLITLVVAVMVYTWNGFFDEHRHELYLLVAMYATTVTAIALAVFATVQLTPRLTG